MSGEYRFREWARAAIGSDSPAAVHDWFAMRGLERTREFWRKYLATGGPPTFVVEVWEEICEISSEPFSRFYEFTPSGRPPRLRRLKNNKKRRKAKPNPQPVPPPPSPHAYFGSRDAS